MVTPRAPSAVRAAAPGRGRHGGPFSPLEKLDSSLHPVLAAELIRLFQDEEVNLATAQVIFTTHGATLLGPSVAERPQGP
ncbi:AAA family ATPase [Streptomyces sp. NPDC047000]|uniref:AAA family ATPase n=1 Tax=Streptomyces sp. NPDC047000 TaxID=3155474 RepID=UPI0033E697D4